MKQLLLLTIYILLPFLGIGQSDFSFNKITTRQGLSHSTVYAITQDDRGYVWIGTREGLNRYDSYGLRTFYAGEDSLSLRDNHITALLYADDYLYVGSSRGVDRYDYKTDRFLPIKMEGESFGLVNQLYQASDSSLFVCSPKGLFKLEGDRLKAVRPDLNVISITEYKKNVFWLATQQQILLINQEGETVKFYPYLKATDDRLLSCEGNISTIFKDRQGEIWIGTIRSGVYRYVAKEDGFEPILPRHKGNPIEANMVRTLDEDEQGNLWIGTESGLFVYQRGTQTFEHFTHSYDQTVSSLSDKAIYCLYRSRENMMWIGTYFGGVNFVKPNVKTFQQLVADGGVSRLSGKAVSQITDDQSGKLWIGTEDGGITIFDRQSGKMNYLRHHAGRNSISTNNVHAIHDDGNGHMWIGTFLGGLNRYHQQTRTFTHFSKQEGDSLSLSNNHVYALLSDSKDSLFIGTQNGLNFYDSKKGTVVPYRPEEFTGKFIYDLKEDHLGNIWVCTMNAGVYYHDRKSQKWFHFNTGNGLPTNRIISAFEDSKQQMWFGSLGGGLIKRKAESQTFTAFTTQDGLPNNNVYGILEDDHQNLWVSTNKGLVRFDPTAETMNSFTISQGVIDNQFNFKSAFRAKDGYMYFGTVNGLCYFHPDSLSFSQDPPAVHLTDFKLFNRSLEIGEDSPLEKQIDETSNITLAYVQNVFTFEFVAINYFSPGNNTYAYYMEGFEDKWNYAGNKRTATYTNLSPGTYLFHLKAANYGGKWSKEKQVTVVIEPPFWMSKWAYGIYLCLLILIGYLYKLYLNARSQEKMVLQLERVEKEKIREVNQHKLNFFTYISHEFKTPLTLIIAAIDKLSEKGNTHAGEQELKLVKRNATRLHHLIDQLMEFRKTESDHTSLHLSKGDMVVFLKDTFESFVPLFVKKQLDYRFNAEIKECVIYFDPDKIDKIVTNLLSNAVKHTNAFGEISMSLTLATQENNRTLKIQITDTGSGLSDGEAEKIFLPFYQSKNETLKAEGTGIGLALVRSLVHYLKGEISVDSQLDQGTTITVTLPLVDQVALSEKVVLGQGNRSILTQDLLYEETETAEVEKEEGKAEYEILIVEDNKELLKFLVSHFSPHYKVSHAADGKTALEKIEKGLPDLVISDVMLPKMDGMTLCRKVKTEVATCHIPVILLTAKANVENKLKGLDEGADAYIPKPFNMKELELVVKNTLNARANLKKHFQQFGNLEGYTEPVNNRDQAFVNKLTELVHKHMDDPDFNVTVLTKEAGVSRTLLHMKLKKLLNLSTTEFIKMIRMQQAAKLLREGLNVSEVAFQVGFKDPSYFSRSFKDKFNISPSEYKEREFVGDE
ncbi:two-component regulator propeller domain-containing protein [Limibacter armeniacum]|uniref:hybrid sensor histidine kinase/response regulator transcription factor n=1 Tax=Limibacter armeniacum TaxID=466084 RepID=UPI002FE55D23